PSADEIAKEKFWMKKNNGGFRKVENLAGNVGYIRFDGFMSPEAAKEPLRAAMDFVADTDALIIDMRFNGGGQPETVQLACSYLFDKRTHLNDIYERKGNKTTEYWTLNKVAGKRYLDKPVFVLTSKRTGSAAEEFSYNLKNLKRATLVGESTWGGANPGDVFRLNDNFNAFVPTGRAINPITKTNWEGTGVQPDIEAKADDALVVAHKAALQGLLADPKNAELRPALEATLKRLGG
ncbi:peptidase, partial [bacterium]